MKSSKKDSLLRHIALSTRNFCLNTDNSFHSQITIVAMQNRPRKIFLNQYNVIITCFFYFIEITGIYGMAEVA